MAENSNIEWTKHTWNPVWGCRKVSPGCKFCYAERMIAGRQGAEFGAIRRTGKSVWSAPYKLNRLLTGNEPIRERLVFTCSMSDFFISEADEYRDEMWKVIRETPNLVYQILTKRPERIADHLPSDWGRGYKNVWLGTSVENQETFDKRVPILAGVPARVRFLSMEPLLESVDISSFRIKTFGSMVTPTTIPAILKIDWVIIGGESGNDIGKWKYRPCEWEWIAGIAQSCISFDIPFFIKQTGTHLSKRHGFRDRKGGDMNEWPENFRVREFPRILTVKT